MVHHSPADAIHMNLAGFKRVDTGQALDQRRFARAVLAHQRVDLALPQREIHIVERLDTGEGHCDAAHCQYNILLHFCLP